MKVYTVQRENKIDYDFSVELLNIGCYADRADAIASVKREYESMREEFESEIEEYSNTELYDPNEYGSGALFTEEDYEHGYGCISYGYQEKYESHIVWVDEWEVM
jgi:hypothetical protein